MTAVWYEKSKRTAHAFVSKDAKFFVVCVEIKIRNVRARHPYVFYVFLLNREVAGPVSDIIHPMATVI